MLVFVPPGTAADPCAGIAAFNAPRPPLSPFVLDFSVALLAVFTLQIVATVALFVHLRAALAFRSLPISLLSMFSYVLLGANVLVMKIAYPAYPCALHAVFWALIPGIQASCSCLRLISLLNQARFAQTAGTMRRLFDRKNSTLTEDSVSTAVSQSLNSVRGAHMFSRTLATLQGALGFSSRESAPFVTGFSSTDTPQNPRRDATTVKYLMATREALGWRALFKTFAAIFLIPTAVAVLAVVFSHDVYYPGNCAGCDIFAELLIATLTLYAILLVVRIRVSQVLVREHVPDPYGMVREIQVNAFVYLGSVVLFCALYGVDPGGLDYNNQVMWEWWLVLGIMVIAWHEHTRHAVQAWRDSRNVVPLGDVASSPRHLEILEALMDDTVRERFDEFAKQHFLTESAMFLSDVSAFERWFYERSQQARTVKSQAIIKRYIMQDAPLQINLSSNVRTAIETGEVSKHMFNGGVKEIATMLKFPHWIQFVAQGGLRDTDAEGGKNARSASRRSSKQSDHSRRSSLEDMRRVSVGALSLSPHLEDNAA
jgi:hypothetical protein